MNIVWLDEPQAQDLSLVGGKVASLSKLAIEFRVPHGFCVTTLAYQNAAAHLTEEVTRAYQALAERSGSAQPSVAVRSSAVDEDGSAASFAGQHETYLNIRGADAVNEAVVRCWQSARSERALAYRRQQGLANADVKLAVLVQQLVASDVSAVVFSANPVTGSRDEVMINASWGLGESIVGGTVTPDTFVVSKSNLQVMERALAEKTRMTVAVEGGTREVDVPRILRAQPSLMDEQAVEMARLAITLEATMGYAVDIECAFAGGQLYLLQCRPITTL